jgi:ketosteroid isomerase-like protein
MANNEQLIRHLYHQFNARDIDGVLSKLSENVSWVNGMEGIHIHGRDAVREYWTHQWTVIDPRVEPKSISESEDGSIVVSVHQIVHDLEGKLLLDETIEHVFCIKDGLVMRFDIQGDSQLSAVSH